MPEPNETHFESEESEATSVANELAGGDDWQVTEGGADEVSSPSLDGPGPRETPPQLSSPAAQVPSLTLDQARQAWNQQTATRAQLREYANQQYQERVRLEEMANAVLRAAQAQQPVQPPQPQDAPQIDPELQRYFDGQQQSLLSQVQQMLAPVLTQAQQSQQYQEVQQQVQAEQAQWGEVRDIVSRAEADYMATPEGAGYNDRVSGYEQAMLNALSRSGVDEAPTRKLVTEQLKGFTMLGMALNVPPPVLLDNYINAVMEFAVQYRSGQNGNGQQRQMQPQQQRQQARMSPQVQIARMATQSGAAGAPPSNGTAQTGGIVGVGDLMSRGLNGKDIEALVKEYGSLDKAIRYLDRVGAELEEIER